MKSSSPSRFAISFSRLRSVVFCILALSLFSLTMVRAANSFSGAIGYGATTTGGRGGTIYHVTNLNDSGAGSFRDAVSASSRIIVFDVGGYIHLLSAVSAKSNLTIAGQTAPGDGIGTYGAEVSFYGQSNIIVRNFRFRDGTLDPSYPGSSSTNSHTNCVSLGSTTNVIFDHCSMEFAAYNNVDAVGAVNLTFQNCIFADPIKEQQFNCHFEGGPATFIDNLWANSHGRSPLTKGNAQYVNNIDYNYQYAFCAGNTSGTFNYDIVNNYFISGPSTSSPSDDFYQVPSNCNAYATGNLLDGNNDGTLNGSADNSTGATVLSTYYFGSSATVPTTSLPTLTPANAYAYVLSSSGALPHDQVDTQVVANVTSLGTSGQLWVSQTSTGLGNSGYGVLNGGTAPVDSDQDGMPDDWETAKGLNPSSAADAAMTSSTGYTNLEDYLNWLALPHAFVAKNTSTGPSSVDIDLSKYAAGFPSGSTFTVSSVSGGTATQSGTGGYLVHFVPTVNTGPVIGGFSFSVTNGSYTMSSTCGVLISSAAAAKDLLWKGDSVTNAWNTTTSNWTNENTSVTDTYAVGDRVYFDDTGSHSPAVNITSVISPSSISVETDSSNYTFSGYGWIGGTTALVKNGAGTLTIAPTIPTTSGTLTSGSAAVTVTSTANLTTGMPVSGTGIPSSTTLSAINSSTSITLSKNATQSTTTTLSFTPYNTYSGPTTFNAGTILLNAGASLGTGTLNLYSTLTNNAGTGTTVSLANSIVVASGTSGTINMGNRMAIGGSASGSGTLNLNINTTVTRDDLSGSFTNFGGTINFAGSGGVRLLINSGNFDNFGGAKVNLGSSVNLQVYTNSAGNTLTVGELSGSGTIYGGTLSGGGTATWSVGGLNTSTTFSGPIQDGSSSKAALTKTGTGTLTLTGTSSYTGATTVSGGVLQMNGTLGTTAVAVSSGAALGASGTVGGTVAINSGASLYLGASSAAGNIGTLVASGGFTAAGSSAGCNLYYDLSSSPSGSNDKVTATAGSLTLSGTVNFEVNMTNGVLGAGTYNLIDGGATLGVSGLTMNLVLPVTSGTTRQTFALARPSSGTTPGYINLVVTGSAGSLTWTGGNGGVWDLNTTASNFSGASPTTFYNLDSVTFDDSSTTGTVTLTGTLQPNVLTVSNSSTAYTFTGSGLIGGATKLVKSGSGTLTISNTTANTYTGGTTLSAGTLAIGNSASTLGTGLVTISGGTLSLISGASLSNSFLITGSSKITSTGNVTIVSSASNTLTSSGSPTLDLSGITGLLTVGGDMSGFAGIISFGSGNGMLRLNSTANADSGSASTLFDLGTGSAILSNRNGGITAYLGAVQGGSNTTLQGRQSGSDTTETNYMVGGLNTDNIFNGAIATGGDQNGVNISKVGTGNWTLGGTSSFLGDVLVQAGTLTVSGSLNNGGGNFEAFSGATLSLSSGTITATLVEIDSGATMTGCGTINGDLQIDGTLSSSCGGTIAVSGDVTVNGTMRLTNGTAITAGGTFTNNGVLDILTGAQTLPANFVNNGIVLDSSDVEASTVSISGANVVVTVIGYSGHNYQLQRSDSLNPASWTNVGSAQAGAGTTLTFMDNGGVSGTQRFYRVVVSP